MKKNVLFLTSLAMMLLSCSSSSPQETRIDGEMVNDLEAWSIPIAEVLDGGPGRDGIPALENPALLLAEKVYPEITDTDLVLGYKKGDDIRAYPHLILDWHEIINDNIGETSLAVTYCPLTGTGIGWNRIINGTETTFGVSGLLFQTNLVPFDRATQSNWSQILNESVNGSLIGTKADLIQLVETDWKTWREMFPGTKIVGLDTGFSRTYDRYPYGNYKIDNAFFLFPTPKDSRLPLKERVHAIVHDDKAKTYRFADFEKANLFTDTFLNKNYLMVGNINFIASFELNGSQTGIDFEYIFDGSGEALIADENGNQWNIFGEVIAGNAQALEPSTSFMGYWFSIPAFYDTEVFVE